MDGQDSRKGGGVLFPFEDADDREQEQIQEDVFTPIPILSVPQLPALEFTAPTEQLLETPSEKGVDQHTQTVIAAPSAGGDLPSRLAHRFAPSVPPTLLSIFPEPGVRFELTLDQTLVIGRDPKRCDLTLFNASVSQKHCQIVVEDDECSILDLGSSNGTFVNGERVTQSQPLRQGDLISIGRFVFMFVWYRFAPMTRPEMLSMEQIRQLLVRLYPTPASVQTLLLASNLFNLPVDITKGSIEQIWERVLQGLRKQDILAALKNIIVAAGHDHPDSSEVKRCHETVSGWEAARQERGLQERVNIDVKNSMILVREILGHHMSQEATSDLEEEETLDPKPMGPPPLALESRARDEKRPALAPQELPFELKYDDSSSAIKIPDALLPPALRPPLAFKSAGADAKVQDSKGLESPPTDVRASIPSSEVEESNARPVEEPRSYSRADTLVESAASLAPSSDLSVGAGSNQADAISADASMAARSTPSAEPVREPQSRESVPLLGGTTDRLGPSARSAQAPWETAEQATGPVSITSSAAPLEGREGMQKKDDAEVPPPPAPPAHRPEVEGDPLSHRTAEVEEDPDRTVAQTAPWEGEPPPKNNRFWVMLAAAVGLVAVAAASPALLNFMGSSSETVETVAAVSKPAGETAAQPDKPSEGQPAATPAAAPAANPAATPGTSGATAATTPAPAAAAPAATPAPAAAAPTSAPAPAPSEKGVPAKPVWEVINFLGDDEKPKYSEATAPAGAEWEPKTSQIKASSLKDCQWMGNKTRQFASKGNKTFRFIVCQTGKAAVDGWVVEAGMKL